MWSPSPLSKNPTAAAADIAATSAPAGIDICPHLTNDAAIGGDTLIEVGGERGAPFEREAAPMPLYNGGDDTMPFFDKWAVMMPLFCSDAATKTSLFQDEAATMPSFDGDATTQTGEAATTRSFQQDKAAMTPSFQDADAMMSFFDWDAITTMPCFKGLAATTSSFQDKAATMLLFDWDESATTPCIKGWADMAPSFQDEAARMPSFDGDFTTRTGEASTTRSFQDTAATMPSFEAVSAMTPSIDCDASIMTMSNIKGYKRHNPRAGKTKTVRGGIGSKRLFQRKSPPGPNQALAGLIEVSVGSGVPCITPLPTSNQRQLKRKVREMEAQALKMNDRVIELEVALQQKDLLINKHVKCIRLLNEKNSDDKKARNLVSSIFDYLMKQYFKSYAQYYVVLPNDNRFCIQTCRNMTSGRRKLRTEFSLSMVTGQVCCPSCKISTSACLSIRTSR
jgi:hypothetical protein